MIDRGAAYRICRKHRARCGENAEADLVECPVGPHILEDGEWDVGQENVGAVLFEGGNSMKVLKMAKFHGADKLMRLRMVQKKNPPFQVTIEVVDGEGKGKRGILHSSNTEVDALAHFNVELVNAERKGWKVAPLTSRGGGLKEIPDLG